MQHKTKLVAILQGLIHYNNDLFTIDMSMKELVEAWNNAPRFNSTKIPDKFPLKVINQLDKLGWLEFGLKQ